MSLAHQALTGPLTVVQFNALWEEGALGVNARIELLDGEMYEKRPIGPSHMGSTTLLAIVLQERLGRRGMVRVRAPLSLDANTSSRPDIFVCDWGHYYAGPPTPRETHLVVEASTSRKLSDRFQKLPAYAAASINEVWMLLPLRPFVEIYRDPDPESRSYRSVQRLYQGDTIAPLAFPDAQIAVADFLPPEANP